MTPPVPAAKRRPVVVWMVRVIAVLAIVAGGTVITAQMLAPEEVQKISNAAVGSVRGAVQEVIQEAEEARGELPSVTLGEPAGNDAVDTSPYGVFPEMQDYATDGLQPVFAAHNGSGGDILLPWELGQHVLVTAADGAVTEMVVTDLRDTPQVGVTTSDISGMRGNILLQTCYWVEDDMKFVALTPVGETPETGVGGDTPIVAP